MPEYKYFEDYKIGEVQISGSIKIGQPKHDFFA
jgi:hypothetical protein